jgi:hypothetical protein
MEYTPRHPETFTELTLHSWNARSLFDRSFESDPAPKFGRYPSIERRRPLVPHPPPWLCFLFQSKKQREAHAPHCRVAPARAAGGWSRLCHPGQPKGNSPTSPVQAERLVGVNWHAGRAGRRAPHASIPDQSATLRGRGLHHLVLVHAG